MVRNWSLETLGSDIIAQYQWHYCKLSLTQPQPSAGLLDAPSAHFGACQSAKPMTGGTQQQGLWYRAFGLCGISSHLGHFRGLGFLFQGRFPIPLLWCKEDDFCLKIRLCAKSLSFSGLELLLDEVYDTIFSALEPARTFTETSIYRILQRRFLGVQLATSGRFRCK